MNRDTAVRTWREVCGSDTVMAMGVVTGRMLEEFATRIEAAERERCAKMADDFANRAWNDARSEVWSDEFELLARNIRRA